MRNFAIGIMLAAGLSSCKREDKVLTYNIVNPTFNTTKSAFEVAFKNADSVKVNHEYSNTTSLISNSESNTLQILYYYSNDKNLQRDTINRIARQLQDAAIREVSNVKDYNELMIKFYNNNVEVNSRKIILK